MSEPASQGDPARRGTWRVHLLYLLLLMAGVFAAWQAHGWWTARRREAPEPVPQSLPQVRVRPSRLAVGPPAPTSGPATEPARPLPDLPPGFQEGTDIEPVQDDPVGIAPPEGAEGRRAYRLPDGSVVARYLWAGSLEQAARHYQDALAPERYRLLDRSVDAEGYHHLTFVREARRVVAALRNDPQDAKMVQITITVVEAAR